MINNDFLQLIELVRKVIKKDNSELSKELFPNVEDIDMWKRLYNLAIKHDVQVFLYEAVKDEKLPEEVKERFYSVYNRAVRKEAIMHIEVSGFLESLEKNNIEYIPLKGWNIKNLYDKPFLRTMTDVDVIVKREDFNRACELIVENGFELDHEGVCNNAYKKPPVTQIEVHHQLFKEESVLHEWSERIISKNGRFEMSDEDAYVYFVAHMAKHFTWDGAGMRNVVDCYLLNEKSGFSEASRKYICEELKKLQLDVFETRINHLCSVWFDGNEYDEDSKILADYVMDGGLYGKQGNAKALKRGSENTGKAKWFIRDIFPDYETLKLSLGYKKMYKILTPVYWVIRIFRGLFCRKGAVAQRVEAATNYEESMDKSKNILDYMGLNTVKY